MQGTYFEAAVTDINPAEQALTAKFPCHAGLEEFEFTVPYDILIHSVGSTVNTFGIKVITPRRHHRMCSTHLGIAHLQLQHCYP